MYRMKRFLETFSIFFHLLWKVLLTFAQTKKPLNV